MNFKVGDKVKCVDALGVYEDQGGPIIKKDKIYTVTEILNLGKCIRVSCGYVGSSFRADRFVLVSKKKAKKKTKQDLIKEYLTLKKKLDNTRAKLKAIYEKNPYQCDNCGCELRWSENGYINPKTGVSLIMCGCYEFTR